MKTLSSNVRDGSRNRKKIRKTFGSNEVKIEKQESKDPLGDSFL